ncbi:hypothetical protein DL768_010642 [Monosporascus sp. mg162]|nr:hypothetical protein DL768_010642 [Monosporascus sp. mg162]
MKAIATITAETEQAPACWCSNSVSENNPDKLEKSPKRSLRRFRTNPETGSLLRAYPDCRMLHPAWSRLWTVSLGFVPIPPTDREKCSPLYHSDTPKNNVPRGEFEMMYSTTEKLGPEIPMTQDRASFEHVALSSENSHRGGVEYQTITTIMQRHGHKDVDTIKMDIEGDEFPALATLMDKYTGKELPVGQFLVELHHFGKNQTV